MCRARSLQPAQESHQYHRLGLRFVVRFTRRQRREFGSSRSRPNDVLRLCYLVVKPKSLITEGTEFAGASASNLYAKNIFPLSCACFVFLFGSKQLHCVAQCSASATRHKTE